MSETVDSLVAPDREPSARREVPRAEWTRLPTMVVLGAAAFVLVLSAHVAMGTAGTAWSPAIPLGLRMLGVSLALGAGLLKLASYAGNPVPASLIVGTTFSVVGVVEAGRLFVLLSASVGDPVSLLQVAGRAAWAAGTVLPLLLLIGMIVLPAEPTKSRGPFVWAFGLAAALVALIGILGPWSRAFPGAVDPQLLALRPAVSWTITAYLLTFAFLWRRPDVSATTDGRWLTFALYLGFLDQTLVAPFWDGVGIAAGTVDAALKGSTYLVAGTGVFLHMRTISREQERAMRLAEREAAERARVEDALARQAARLTAANEELGQYAYLASHDLQEPLRMVTNYLQLIERRYGDALDDDGREFIDFAVDGARRMKQLTGDLLMYSRVDEDESPAGRADAGDAFDAAVRNLEVSIREAGAEVTRGELPLVDVSHSHLTQLFQNLIGNAIKFRRAEVVPRVRAEAVKEGSHWRFSVSDNGIGIEEKHVDRVFGVFQRLHRRDAYPGSGIGLALCKKIVERHGGTIRFSSRMGEGTTFVFTLPTQPVDRRPGFDPAAEDPELQERVSSLIGRARELI